MSVPGRPATPPPRPGAVADLDGLAAALVELRTWAGNPSYAVLATEVGRLRAARGEPGARPGKVTVYDCFRPGRSRIDPVLLTDLVAVLGVPVGEEARWRTAWQRVSATPYDVAPAGATTAALPPPQGRLVGRDRPAALLAERPPGTVSRIVGLPGAGKTELALHVAHHWRRLLGADCVALVVDLHGFDPDRAPLEPAMVLDRLLRALGVAGADVDRLPAVDRRDLLWRTIGRRPAVLLLDNAADAGQVAPLLPLPPRVRMLVTSRRSLPELDDQPAVVLGELDEGSALEVLADAVGRDRIAAEPAAARRIVRCCGRMALDLVVAGARIARTDDWTLADHASRLESLPAEETMRPALQASYDQLPPDVRRSLRMIALHPGARLRVADLAALADLDPAVADDHLDRLGEEHLVAADPGGRHGLHDLVRAFALRLGVLEDARSARCAAYARLADARLADCEPRTRPGDPDLAWLRDEIADLLAVATATPLWEARGQLVRFAEVLAEHLEVTAYGAASEELLRLALAEGDPPGERRLRLRLGRTLEVAGRLDEALEQFRLAADHEAAEDDVDAERQLNGMGNVLKRMGRFREAVSTYVRAARLAARRGNPLTEGRARGNLADTLRILGHPAWSEAAFEAATVLATRAGDDVNLAIMRSNRALLAEQVGDPALAVALGRESIAAFAAVGFTELELSGRVLLARHLLMAGDPESARVEVEGLWAATEQLPYVRFDLRMVLAQLHELDGDPTGAEHQLLRVIDEARAHDSALPEIEASNRLGRLARRRGDRAAARDWHERAAHQARRVGDRPELDAAERALVELRPRG